MKQTISELSSKTLYTFQKFDFNENKPVSGAHFHKNGFERRLVLTFGNGLLFVMINVTKVELALIVRSLLIFAGFSQYIDL